MSEAMEQEAFVEWCEWNRVLVFAIPNGGSRHPAEAANLKKQGVKSGVPDLFIPTASNGYSGLFIEMKFGKNRPTDNQETWLTILSRQGYKTTVCWSCDEAIVVTKAYLGGK